MVSFAMLTFGRVLTYRVIFNNYIYIFCFAEVTLLESNSNFPKFSLNVKHNQNLIDIDIYFIYNIFLNSGWSVKPKKLDRIQI